MHHSGHALLAGIAPECICKANALGLELRRDLGVHEWSEVITLLARNARRATASADTVTAWLGDALAYGSSKYRGQIAELAKAAGLHPTTLRNAKLVCRRIPMSCRRDELSWAHHTEVGKAFEEAAKINQWLEIAVKEGLSKAQLRARIRGARGERSGPVRCSAGEIESFALMRELRAAERLVRNNAYVWKQWSPCVCGTALKEISMLVGFFHEIERKATCAQGRS